MEREVKGLGLLEDVRRRRKEAREQYRRLVHPEPLISELRRKKKIKAKLLVAERAGDFVEGVAKMLRSPEVWQSSVAGTIISRVLNVIL